MTSIGSTNEQLRIDQTSPLLDPKGKGKAREVDDVSSDDMKGHQTGGPLASFSSDGISTQSQSSEVEVLLTSSTAMDDLNVESDDKESKFTGNEMTSSTQSSHITAITGPKASIQSHIPHHVHSPAGAALNPLCTSCTSLLSHLHQPLSSPFTHLLSKTTRHIPRTSSEEHSIHTVISSALSRISDIEDAEMKLQALMDDLKNEKRKVQAWVDDHRVMIAPVWTLPPEVLSEIFMRVVAYDDTSSSEIDYASPSLSISSTSSSSASGLSLTSDVIPSPTSGTNPSPTDREREKKARGEITRASVKSSVTLSWVCRQWRDVALQTPQLWTRICVVELPEEIDAELNSKLGVISTSANRSMTAKGRDKMMREWMENRRLASGGAPSVSPSPSTSSTSSSSKPLPMPLICLLRSGTSLPLDLHFKTTHAHDIVDYFLPMNVRKRWRRVVFDACVGVGVMMRVLAGEVHVGEVNDREGGGEGLIERTGGGDEGDSDQESDERERVGGVIEGGGRTRWKLVVDGRGEVRRVLVADEEDDMGGDVGTRSRSLSPHSSSIVESGSSPVAGPSSSPIAGSSSDLGSSSTTRRPTPRAKEPRFPMLQTLEFRGVPTMDLREPGWIVGQVWTPPPGAVGDVNPLINATTFGNQTIASNYPPATMNVAAPAPPTAAATTTLASAALPVPSTTPATVLPVPSGDNTLSSTSVTLATSPPTTTPPTSTSDNSASTSTTHDDIVAPSTPLSGESNTVDHVGSSDSSSGATSSTSGVSPAGAGTTASTTEGEDVPATTTEAEIQPALAVVADTEPLDATPSTPADCTATTSTSTDFTPTAEHSSGAATPVQTTEDEEQDEGSGSNEEVNSSPSTVVASGSGSTSDPAQTPTLTSNLTTATTTSSVASTSSVAPAPTPVSATTPSTSAAVTSTTTTTLISRPPPPPHPKLNPLTLFTPYHAPNLSSLCSVQMFGMAYTILPLSQLRRYEGPVQVGHYAQLLSMMPLLEELFIQPLRSTGGLGAFGGLAGGGGGGGGGGGMIAPPAPPPAAAGGGAALAVGQAAPGPGIINGALASLLEPDASLSTIPHMHLKHLHISSSSIASTLSFSLMAGGGGPPWLLTQLQHLPPLPSLTKLFLYFDKRFIPPLPERTLVPFFERNGGGLREVVWGLSVGVDCVKQCLEKCGLLEVVHVHRICGDSLLRALVVEDEGKSQRIQREVVGGGGGGGVGGTAAVVTAAASSANDAGAGATALAVVQGQIGTADTSGETGDLGTQDMPATGEMNGAGPSTMTDNDAAHDHGSTTSLPFDLDAATTTVANMIAALEASLSTPSSHTSGPTPTPTPGPSTSTSTSDAPDSSTPNTTTLTTADTSTTMTASTATTTTTPDTSTTTSLNATAEPRAIFLPNLRVLRISGKIALRVEMLEKVVWSRCEGGRDGRMRAGAVVNENTAVMVKEDAAVMVKEDAAVMVKQDMIEVKKDVKGKGKEREVEPDSEVVLSFNETLAASGSGSATLTGEEQEEQGQQRRSQSGSEEDGVSDGDREDGQQSAPVPWLLREVNGSGSKSVNVPTPSQSQSSTSNLDPKHKTTSGSRYPRALRELHFLPARLEKLDNKSRDRIVKIGGEKTGMVVMVKQLDRAAFLSRRF